MGIEVVWDSDAKNVLRYIYDGRWTWSDLEKAREVAAQYEKSVAHRVDVIVDVQKSSLLPNGTITRARQVATTAPTTHPNEGITVIVGAGAFVRSIYDVMLKVYPDMIRRRGILLAKNLQEARELIVKNGDLHSSTQT